MDVSGASGQPRSGDDKPTEHPASPTPPPTAPEAPAPPDDARPAPTDAPEAADAGSASPAQEGAPETPDPAAAPAADARPADGPGGDTSAPDTRPAAPDASPAAPDPAADTPGDNARPASGPGDETPASGARPAAPTPDAPPAAPRAEHDTGHDQENPAPDGRGRQDGRPAPAADGEPGAVPARGGQDGRPGPAGGEPGTAPDHTTAHPDPSGHRTLAHTGHPAGPGMAKGEPPRRPREPGGGILMGRPFGVPVYVAPSWFLVAALITWVFGGQLDRVLPQLGAARYLVSLFFAVAFYASVLVHELAHTVAAIRFKLPVRRIQLQFFGGVSEIEKEAETPGREFVLAFVGPLLSLVLAGVFYLAMKPVQPGTVPGILLAGLMVSNLIVAIFNLLPGLPLDGGRMLRAVVWKITGKPMSGTVAAAWVGRALAVAVLIGLPLLNSSGALGGGNQDTGGMNTVTDALLAAILAAIIWTGAGNSLRMARLREHLPELRARTLTRRAVPVETGTPLSEALRRANAAGARALVVVDADGHPLSLVRESAIVGVPEHRRPWVAVSSLAQDLTEGMRVSAELAGEELLDALRAAPATEYLVVEETGEIYGVLSAADVERAFVRAMARPA
ncbi:Zn-dependent protease (includes SpoIVFB) [Streptomyces misionensis]|uniref:Zn-dependent protease (Includes SpoIVFB) n=1 Tax=Streptomyces misionensis TaxID=67331 RepID=A0A1H4ST77_9ACTN|nr:site-2 protease family protein [Streptomyces misionensis]SEC47415.1 Zn-dependent protease (includes SpoIVFB) [Streptomyces misionensis]